MTTVTDCITLNTGADIPVLGLGTWKSKAGEVVEAVKVAIDAGYRHIDCAYAYGNEEEVGQAIGAKIADGTITRSQIFVTSKLAPGFNAPERVEEGCKASLAKLKLKYLDLYLVHWPVAMKEGGGLLEDTGRDVSYLDTWREMEKLVGQGLVKAIGVSNFNEQQLQEVLNVCKVKPAVNQFEVHPYLNNEQLVNFCKDHGIVVTAFAPFASPDPGRPTRKDDDPKPLENEKIGSIAVKHNKTPGQVILKWLLQQGLTTIPKSVTPSRIEQNIQLNNWSLSQDDMDTINSQNINFRACYGAPFVKSKYYPFK